MILNIISTSFTKHRLIKETDTRVQYLQEIEAGCPRNAMVKAMDCGIVVREFVLQSRYYVHFGQIPLGKV